MASFAVTGQTFDRWYARPSAQFMNLGYLEQRDVVSTWRRKDFTSNYQRSCRELARRLGVRARLESKDDVVDVGCGYGLQDVLFVNEFGIKSVKAYNIGPNQIAVAQKMLKSEPCQVQERITFKVGDAVRLPEPDCRVKKVLSLESAFHYNTREGFFSEAYRILVDGGRLAIADFLPKPGVFFRPTWGGSRFFPIME